MGPCPFWPSHWAVLAPYPVLLPTFSFLLRGSLPGWAGLGRALLGFAPVACPGGCSRGSLTESPACWDAGQGHPLQPNAWPISWGKGGLERGRNWPTSMSKKAPAQALQDGSAPRLAGDIMVRPLGVWPPACLWPICPWSSESPELPPCCPVQEAHRQLQPGAHRHLAPHLPPTLPCSRRGKAAMSVLFKESPGLKGLQCECAGHGPCEALTPRETADTGLRSGLGGCPGSLGPMNLAGQGLSSFFRIWDQGQKGLAPTPSSSWPSRPRPWTGPAPCLRPA